ncbi:protein inscuteable homolog [Saccostrea echinata]|uniref:protein inscuteable homolog n=1 Tax=Saccostrea echinata TaxID=191078 RepID=UPI002A81AAE5|nr:protein inscuteable homolog [Saccostrea echinata]
MLRHTKTKASGVTWLRKRREDPVQQWLVDIRWASEMECMNILQGKSIVQSVEKSAFHTSHIKGAIDVVKNESNDISGEFSVLFKLVEAENWSAVQTFTIQLTCHVRGLINDCNQNMPNPPLHILEQQEVVMGECAKLAQQVESAFIDSENQCPSKIPVINQLTFLGQSFSRLVDLCLGYLVQKIVDILDEANDPMVLSQAIGSVVNLGLEGEHMCYILAREGGVRALLDICRTENLRFCHAQSLRALATISCVTESLFEIEKEGGMWCLLDLLSDPEVRESVRGEVAGVIAQVTSPCLENAHQMSGMMDNMEDLLINLLGLCSSTKTEEIFLLSSAAIANMTFMDSSTCEILQKIQAPRILCSSCQSNIAKSLFSKDQVATILANMVAVDVCRQDVVTSGGIDICLELLHESPLDYKTPAEIAACERVQQKAAIALTRMCRDENNAATIIKAEGVPRLIQLCRDKQERSSSDAVLVACLAALRKINSLNKLEDLSAIDNQQLIQPKLMDSFLICTNTDENFV